MHSPDVQRPILDVALPLDDQKTHRAWILEKLRDLELQDFFSVKVFNTDWKPLVAAIKRQLDGYTGRLGIHGPFWGVSIGTKDPDVGSPSGTRHRNTLAGRCSNQSVRALMAQPSLIWQ